MWIAEAEGTPAKKFATEHEALQHAKTIALNGKRAVVWELEDNERGDK